MLVKLLTALAAALVLAIGGMIFLGEARQPGNASGEVSERGQTGEDIGVTVLTRKPYVPHATSGGPTEPKKPADVTPVRANGPAYAMELGAAPSFSALSTRFATIAGQNAEAGFDRLEPHATLVETDKGLEARLLVGPFASQAEAEAACATLALPQGVTCSAVMFDGERIARQ